MRPNQCLTPPVSDTSPVAERLQDRLTAFPNEFHRAQEQLLAAELAAAQARRTQLEAQLLPLRRHTA